VKRDSYKRARPFHKYDHLQPHKRIKKLGLNFSLIIDDHSIFLECKEFLDSELIRLREGPNP